jgi:hypothetical protein
MIDPEVLAKQRAVVEGTLSPEAAERRQRAQTNAAKRMGDVLCPRCQIRKLAKDNRSGICAKCSRCMDPGIRARFLKLVSEVA